MHVTTKDAVQNEEQAKELGVDVGAHILTFTIEGDGPVALASDKATFSGKIISLKRTDSGGITGQLVLEVKEPAPEVVVPTDPYDQAVAYFVGKGFTEADAKAQVEKFGASRVLAQASKEHAQKQADLDKELEALLSPPEPEKASEKPASPAVN